MKDDRLDDEETVGALLRAAGGRDAPPAGLASEVRAAVHAEWRAVVEERRRRRRRITGFALAAGLGAVAVGAGFLLPRMNAPAAVVAGVVRVDGRVDAGDGGDGDALAAGATVRAGEVLNTAAGARVALAWSAGGSVRIDAGSRVEFAADRVRLREGAVYVESNSAAGVAPLVETPLGLVRHLGTRYEVRVQPGTLAVTVRDGRIALEASDPRAPRDTEAAAGERVLVDASGRLEREHVSAWSEAWGWAEAVAPPFAIEGRTLDEFVAWQARERGLELRYVATDVREAAAGLVLRGSIAGLAPADALTAVLATTRFRAEIRDGVLVVAVRDDTAGALR